MGQRTMFFTVAEDTKGNMKVCGYYHGWGIGRIMLAAAMTCVFTNERRMYGKTSLDGLTFNASEQGFHPEFKKTYKAGDDLAKKVWNNPRMIGEFRGDNNNGAVVLYAKDTGEDYGPVEYKIGFLLGSEDVYGEYNGEPYNTEAKELGPDFDRWLTLEEWAGLSCNKDYLEKFLPCFKGFMDDYGVAVKTLDWNY